LKNLLIGVSIFVLAIILIILGINSIRHFEYEEIKFDVVKEGDIIFYRTSIPVIYNGKEVPYNFYLRNDPRKLNIPVYGEINFKENMVLEVTTEELFCEGDWNLAMRNLINLYELLGINVVKDENSTCDEQGRYMFVRIQESNETNIEQFGPVCYNLNVNNCEILKIAEQLMIETLIKFNKRGLFSPVSQYVNY